MSTTNSNVNYTVTARDAGASATFAKIGKEASQVNRTFDQLKASFGRGSNLKEFGEILAGGGVIAGLALGIRETAHLAKAFEKMSDAFVDGKGHLADFALEMVKTVPIFGNMVQSVQSSFDAITKLTLGFKGSQIALEAFNFEENLANNKRMADQKKLEQARQEYESSRKKGFEESRRMLEQQEDFFAAPHQRKPIEVKLLVDPEWRRKLVEDTTRDIVETNRRQRRESLTSRLDSLQEERDRIAGSMMEVRARSGATAANIGRGMEGVLASRERASSDPGIKIAEQQKKSLESIDKTIKEVRDQLKLVNNTQPIASFN